MSEKLDRAAARARCEKATPGPWEIWKGAKTLRIVSVSRKWVCRLYLWASERSINSSIDAEFIAHARTDLPLALAELDAKDARIERLKAKLLEATGNDPEGHAMSTAAACPGQILLHEFMEPSGMTIGSLARIIGVKPGHISQIVRGQCAISADTALLFADVFKTTAEFWMNLQSLHDLEIASLKAGKEKI